MHFLTIFDIYLFIYLFYLFIHYLLAQDKKEFVRAQGKIRKNSLITKSNKYQNEMSLQSIRKKKNQMNKNSSTLAVHIEDCQGANHFIKSKPSLNESQSSEQNIDYQIPMCSKHTDTLLSLYDVDLRQRRCPKCVIYCEDRTTYINCRFIEIDQMNKVQNVLSGEVKKLQQMIKNIEQGFLKKAQDSKAQVEKSVMEKLKREYQQHLNKLNSYYESEKMKNLKQIDQAWENQICQILKFVQKVKLQLINIPTSTGTKLDKLDKVSESIISQDECKRMENKLIQNVPLFQSKLAQLQKSVSWVAKFQLVNIEKEYQKIQSISKIRNIELFGEEELLIDLSSPSRKCSQSATAVVTEKFLQDCKTDRTNVTNLSIEQDKISLKSSKTISTSGMSRVSAIGSKSQLVIQNIAEINKIDTQIREISAKNLAITNTDAKKVLELVNKSFVKVLDLYGNKISSIFVKDLTKAHVGKYLKIIRLNGNNIDTKDAAVFKKIEQLKSQGVSIVL